MMKPSTPSPTLGILPLNTLHSHHKTPSLPIFALLNLNKV